MLDRPPDAGAMLELLPLYYVCICVSAVLGVIPFDTFSMVIFPAVFILGCSSVPAHEEWPESAWRFLVVFGIAFFFCAPQGWLFGLVLLSAVPAWITHFKLKRLTKFVASLQMQQDIKRRFSSG